MQHLQPNTTLQGGKYRIERVLGQGGFGITYLAEQVSLGRKVAIKEFFMKDLCTRGLDTHTMATPTSGSKLMVERYRQKFIKEARSLAMLDHPNIIGVIEVFEENETVYYSMPYYSRGSLSDYVATHGALTEGEALKYVRDVASALKYMHETMHICHYDVKPANILLDDNMNAVLIDFGISKNYDSRGHETSTTPVGLTEGYAPIEQYSQNVEEFSPVSDVYALGATLYYLLHSETPVSAPRRAGGVPLKMRSSLTNDTKHMLNSSMKVSKTERAKSVDVFLDTAASSYLYEKRKKNNTWIWITIVLFFVFCGIISKCNQKNKTSFTEMQEDSCYADTSIIDSSVYYLPQNVSTGEVQDSDADLALKKVQLYGAKKEYTTIINMCEELGRENDYWGLYYFLYDITDDRIPELWVQIKTDEEPNSLDGILVVYTYSENKIKRIFKGDDGHPYHHSFHGGDGYVIMNSAHMDWQSWQKYLYSNGYIYEREVFSVENTPSYKDPPEPEISTYEVTNLNPIKHMELQ